MFYCHVIAVELVSLRSVPFCERCGVGCKASRCNRILRFIRVLVLELPLGLLVLDVALQLARNISKIFVVVLSSLSFKGALLKVVNKRSSCVFDCGWYGDVRIF